MTGASVKMINIIALHEWCATAQYLASGSDAPDKHLLTMAAIFDTRLKRFALASGLWLLAWPLLYFVKIGEITGPKAWFWIVGELNYPVIAIVFVLLDSVFQSWGMKPWIVFAASILIICVGMPFYYQHYGFALGVSIEARFL